MTDIATNKSLLLGDLRILQESDGYRYSIDPFLLAGFTAVPEGGRVADLGSGSGVISLLLARKTKALKITGIELQAQLVELSRRSVELNGFDENVEIMQGDVRHLRGKLTPESFDVVVSNPPYRTPTSGRLATGHERCLARHELAGGLVDFLRSASFLLKTGGRFFIVYLAERLPELMAEMRSSRLEPKRLRMVHSRKNEVAQLVLVEGRKNGRPGMKIEPPLVVYQGAGRDYSEEVLAMYATTVTVISNQ